MLLSIVVVLDIRFCVVVLTIWRCVVRVEIVTRAALPLAGRWCFFLPDAMNARAWVDLVIDGPVRTFSSISEWTRDFFETWVEGQIMANRVLCCVRFWI